MSQPLLSIVIPTFNGAHKIPNVIRALAKQSFLHFEVIVVVDGSTDDTDAVLAAHSNVPFSLIIVHQQNKGRSAARNRGAKEAMTNLLLFLDDDMRPVPDWVARHLHHHGSAQSILVGAQLEEIPAMQSDIQRYKASLSRKWTKPLMSIRGPLPKENLFLTAANFSVPANLFWELGGFDEQLTDAEDFDLAVRAHQTGVPIYFSGDALAWHDDFISCRSYVFRLRQYRAAQLKLKELKPVLYQAYSQYNYKGIGKSKRLIYYLFAQKWVVRWIDEDKCHWLPRAIRYKLYDITTTGLTAYFHNRVL